MTDANVTVIRNCPWIVAHDDARGGHVYASGDVAFAGDRITHVGGAYEGPKPAREIDGAGMMAMPGLVNVHSHPFSEPMNKGFMDELGSTGLYNSSLYEFMALFDPDEAGMQAANEVAFSELLQSGVTTLVDLSIVRDGWLETFAASGLRGVLAPMYRSAGWGTRNGHVVEYDWDEAAGERAMAAALATIDAANAHPSGRFSGMIAPAQIDTCAPALLKESRAEARRRGVPLQIHAAQSVVEFHEITRRHGRTPIEWLDDLGLLEAGTIIGHGIFLNDHPWLHWAQADDLGLLARSGAGVAHCPTIFQRRGIALNTFGRYRRAGIPVGIGTDTYPHNMIEEMRHAAITSRVVAGDPYDLRTSDVFDAATTGGAALLGRDDIGRLAPGAKADLALVDLDHPGMRPLREPIRSMIYVAGERPIRTVFVDGAEVVTDGRARAFDFEDAMARLEAAQRRAEVSFRALDPQGRTHDQASPFVYGRAE